MCHSAYNPTRLDAERRAGELVIEEQANGKLAPKHRPKKESQAATLSKSGITKRGRCAGITRVRRNAPALIWSGWAVFANVVEQREQATMNDESRTTPLGVWRYALSYLRAAKTLDDAD